MDAKKKVEDEPSELVPPLPTSVSKHLEPLAKDQFFSNLRSAVACDPFTLDSIRASAVLDPSHRKRFAPGLGLGTIRVLELSSGARYGPKLPRHNPNPLRKIYVGNVPPYVDGTRLREFFARYGEIEEGPIGFDPNTGKSKGFVLFVYRSAASAREALVESSKNFEGHLLYCESPTGPPPNTAATAEAIAAQLDSLALLNHQARVLEILALLNRGAATTSANQGPAVGYQGNPGSQGAQPPPSSESGGGSSY